MRIFWGTVFYEQAKPFLGEFINSLNLQGDKDFKAIIINDDMEKKEIASILAKASFEYEIIDYQKRYTPVGLRIMLILEAIKRNAELLVLGDADDIFSSNRIESIKNKAIQDNSCTFFYNDLFTFSGDTVFPPLPNRIAGIESISDYNFLGMSNTAIRTSKLDRDSVNSLFEGEQPIFDWYLYSRLLIDGATGRHVDGTATYYRYHGNNLVGNQDADQTIIDKEIEVKKRHYKSLEKYSSLMKKRYNEYENGFFITNRIHNPHFWWDYTTPSTTC